MNLIARRPAACLTIVDHARAASVDVERAIPGVAHVRVQCAG
jgi:hypothetical protein